MNDQRPTSGIWLVILAMLVVIPLAYFSAYLGMIDPESFTTKIIPTDLKIKMPAGMPDAGATTVAQMPSYRFGGVVFRLLVLASVSGRQAASPGALAGCGVFHGPMKMSYRSSSWNCDRTSVGPLS